MTKWKAFLREVSFWQDPYCQIMSLLHALSCLTTFPFLHAVSLLPGESSSRILSLKDQQSGDMLFTALNTNHAGSESEWRLEKTGLHLPFISPSFLSFLLFFSQNVIPSLSNPKAIKLKQDSRVQRVIWVNPFYINFSFCWVFLWHFKRLRS